MAMWEWVKETFSDPTIWIFLAAIIAALGGWVSLRHQRQQAQDTKGWLTGGDSWAYYEPRRTGNRNLAFFVRHTGKYPAYDVVLRVRQQERCSDDDPIYVAAALLGGRGFDWTVSSETLTFPEMPTPGEPVHNLKLEISMRSGTIIIQHIRLWEEKGRWHSRSRDVEKIGFGPLKVPEDFKEAQDLPLQTEPVCCTRTEAP